MVTIFYTWWIREDNLSYMKYSNSTGKFIIDRKAYISLSSTDDYSDLYESVIKSKVGLHHNSGNTTFHGYGD